MSDTKPSKIRASFRFLIAFVIAFDVAFLAQKIGGAYESEFGAHPDEAAHYVTGLFVHDAIRESGKYAASGFEGSPVAAGKAFADDFYAHYPKVALGVWPPAFYVAQSGWTLPFGESRFSILLFMAALAGCVATLIYRAIRTEFGDWAGAAAAILWLSAPLVRAQYGMVMAETLSTLTMLGATLAWGRFLDDGRKRDAIAFAVLASAAILTKGTGLALALMCALSILLARKWRILARPALWSSAILVAVLAGPWTWYFRDYGTKVGGWSDNSGGFSRAFTLEALPHYARELTFVCGVAVAAFAIVGMLTRLRGERIGRWCSLTALVLAVYAFQSLIPVGIEDRHMLPAVPALVMLAIAGLFAVARLPWLRGDGREQVRRERLWVVLLLIIVLPFAAMHRGQKGCTGFQSIAEEIMGKAEPAARILVSSDASGEGMLISEIAMRDQRPNLTIERASKSLVKNEGRTWDGKHMRNRFPDDAALLDHLKRAHLAYIVLDDAVPEHKRAPYHDQLKRVLEDNVSTFWPISQSPITRDGEAMRGPVVLYRVVATTREILLPR